MLGIYRFYLSLLVCFSHLWEVTLFKTGAQAVVCFFVLSGFLMCRVVEETYGRSLTGFVHYISNRFLRIYPLYWLILVFSIVMSIMIPSGVFYSHMVFLNESATIFSNITLINLYPAERIFVPPAWTLTVECYFYILIGLIPLSLKRTIPLCIISAAALVYITIFPTKIPHTALLVGLYGFALGVVVHYAGKYFTYGLNEGLYRAVLVILIPVLFCLYFIIDGLGIPVYHTIYIAGGLIGVFFLYFLDSVVKSNVIC